VANTYTPRLGLRQPAQGDDLWDDDINLNASITELALSSFLLRGGVITGCTLTALGGLSVRVAAGSLRVAGALYAVAQVDKVCADNAASFVYVDSLGAVVAATSLPSGNYAALALVETAAGSVVRISDLRCKICDVQKEHDAEGKHTDITPTHIYPTTGDTGAYGRSLAAGYQDPETRVNNLILKNDPTPLLALTGKSNGWSLEYTASALGSGYVPARANGLVVCARVYDTMDNLIWWKFYPSDAPADDDIRFAAVSVGSYPGSYAYSQVMFRLSSLGKFILECYAPGGTTTAQITLRLVGWTEPA
jgi:hypothetical protein